MTLIAVASASGAPGVTTAALALASCWPAGVTPVLAETDPAGGDLQVLFGLPDSPGMVSLAAAGRRAAGPDLLWQHVQWLTAGLAALPGPVGAEQATATASMLGGTGYAPLTAASAAGTVIIADCGRAGPGTPAAPLLAAADQLLLVTATAPEAIARTAALLPALQAASRALSILLSGIRGPWPAEEIAAALGAPVAGRLPRDRAAAAALRGIAARRGPATRWRNPRRLPLLTAAAAIAATLSPPGRTSGAPAGTPASGAPAPAPAATTPAPAVTRSLAGEQA
jgi:MinD-like ATPase involved in chromosome partitioning or flagellar assembly